MAFAASASSRGHCLLLPLLRRHLSTTAAAVPRLPVDPALLRRLARARRFSDIEALLEPLKSSAAPSPSPSPEPLLAGASYGILVKSLCLSPGGAASALPVLAQMAERGVPASAVIYTTILDSFYKERRPADAERVWNEMLAKGLAPDLPAYNVRAMHRALHGNPEQVLALLKEMQSLGLNPDTITYNYLIASYCAHGRFGEAMRVYKGLEEKGCAPNHATYKNLLASLCKNEEFELGLEVFDDGVKRGKVPDLGTVRILVEGLMRAGKVRAAKRAVTGLRKKFPEDFTGEWKSLEKVVGLSKDGGGGSDPAAATATATAAAA
uniref:Pentatricopeptide repeat-containing protein n=1 Tax=Ananas comosus var. bracteatus TaxID=296719 RepID=A0A6V7PJ61_ANACO|nr:unnamed protein product [Ananas comosus var. bracteatus]